MKKMFAAALLAFAVILSSCATAETVLPEKKTVPETAAAATEREEEPIDVTGAFSVGYSRQDITPSGRVPLAGYGNTATRISTVVMDRIYATFIAVSDTEGNTVLIATLDLISLPADMVSVARGTVSRATGIPADNILLCCTHTHASVAAGTSSPLLDAWGTVFYEAMRRGAKAALADRDISDIYIGNAEVSGMNFVRRYLCENGGYCGDNYPNPTSPVAHETEVDNDLQVIKFDRNERKDIVLANFGAHAAFSKSSDTFISADFVGAARDDFEERTDMYFAFFQAAAGNLNPTGRLSGETQYHNKIAYGKALSSKIYSTLFYTEKVSPGKVMTKSRTVTLAVDHSLDDKYDIAKKIHSLYYDENNKTEAQRLITENGFDSIFTAGHIMGRRSRGETDEITVYAVSIGDIAFVGAPYEMFDTNGAEIKAASPFEMTFVCEQTNGKLGYIPSAEAFPHGGYEVTSCPFVAGAGEILSAAFISMLNEMYGG